MLRSYDPALVLGVMVPMPTLWAYTTLQVPATIKKRRYFFIACVFNNISKMKTLQVQDKSEIGGCFSMQKTNQVKFFCRVKRISASFEMEATQLSKYKKLNNYEIRYG
jgi:hypothetical protein